MKIAYPVVFSQIEDGWYMASIPDLNVDTQGQNLPEAIAMARDAIGMAILDKQDDGKDIPAPSLLSNIKCEPVEIVSMVDIDITEYRRAHDLRAVRRNVTLPSWLDIAATRAGVNVSAILQSALKQELHIQTP